jgi:PAS domain S-box-containing protein
MKSNFINDAAELLSLTFPVEWVKAALVLALFSTGVIIVLFSYLNRYTRKLYFRYWTVAWMFYAIWLGACISLEESPNMPFLVMARRASIGISALFMFWGSLLMTKHSRRQRELGLGVAMIVIWSWIAAYKVAQPVWITLPVFVLLSSASIFTGRLYLGYRHVSRGANLLATGFVLWGLQLLGLAFQSYFSPAGVAAGYFMSATLSLFIAMGMVVQVLEQARERNETLLGEFKKGVAQRRLLEQEVSLSEQKYRVLFDSASDAIFLADLKTLEVVEANRSAGALLLSASVDLVGRKLPELCPLLHNATGHLLDNKRMMDSVFRSGGEFHMVRADGSQILCEGSVTLVEYQKQPVLQVNIREIGDRKKMEQRLRQAETLSALGQLVAGVAHELNNPLAVVMGYAQILARQDRPPEKTRKDITRILHESERAAKIVRNLLAFARPREPQMSAVDFNRLISEVVESQENQAQEFGIRIVTEFAKDLPATKADSGQMEQVFTNLITNSIQALAEHAGPRTLALKTEEVAGNIRMSVADSGPGIAPEIIGRVFDPFFTTKTHGKGTGLGLSICHSIVQNHKGRIWVESQRGKGAQFFVEIPVVSWEAEQEPALAAPQPQPVAHAAKHRILIVDDEPGIVEILCAVLGGNGYMIETAANGNEALARLSANRYDLMISDLSMPEMDGRQLYEAVRQRHPDLAGRIIFVTGDTVSPSSRAFLERTGNRWLSKPFSLGEVERLVGTCLCEEQPRAAVSVAGPN